MFAVRAFLITTIIASLFLLIAERDAIVDRFRDCTISSALSERLLSDVGGLIEASHFNGRSGYNAVARRSLGFGRWLRRRFSCTTGCTSRCRWRRSRRRGSGCFCRNG